MMSSLGPPPGMRLASGLLKGTVFRVPEAGAARAAPAPAPGPPAPPALPARPGETIHFNAVGAAARRFLGLARVSPRLSRLLLRAVVTRGRLGLVGIRHPAAGSASAALRAPSATMAAAGGAVTDRDLKRPRALGGPDLARADEAPRLGERAGAGLQRGHLRRERRLPRGAEMGSSRGGAFGYPNYGSSISGGGCSMNPPTSTHG